MNFIGLVMTLNNEEFGNKNLKLYRVWVEGWAWSVLQPDPNPFIYNMKNYNNKISEFDIGNKLNHLISIETN